jgi:hypothetical protein
VARGNRPASAWIAFVFRDAVTTPYNGDERPEGGPEQERGVRRNTPNNPSMGRTHAFDARVRMDAQGLRAAGIAQRNAAGELSALSLSCYAQKAGDLQSIANPAQRMR